MEHEKKLWRKPPKKAKKVVENMNILGQIRAGALPVPETPCLVIDEEIARKNILRVQNAVNAAGCALRPHIKTHKMPYFTRLQLEAGAAGITCAKVSEAEVMAEAGAEDIFIAYPMVGEFRIKRAFALQQKIRRLILAADSLDCAAALSHAAQAQGLTAELRLEIDTGAKRTGVLREQAVELAKTIAALPNLRLTGIYTFKSLLLAGEPTQDNEAAGREEAQLMLETAQALRAAGIPIDDISVGSTPTGLQAASTGLVTEVRPGTYIFGDWMLVQERCARPEDLAARMYATVVSTPAPHYAVLDGGTKTFPMDIPLDTPPYFYPGYAIPMGKDGNPDENLQLRRMNEEHGILTAKNGVTGLRVGQVLELLPIHICTAVNLQNHVFVGNEDGLRAMDVAARGMLV